MKRLFLSFFTLALLATSSIAQGPSYPYKISRGTPSSYSVTNVSGTALAANQLRRGAIIINDGSTKCYLSINGGAAAVSGQGIVLYPSGGAYVMDLTQVYTGAITAVTASSTTTLSITEYN